MNQFVDAARNKVREFGGFFDKFTGDGILALFGTDCRVDKGSTPKLDDCRTAARQAWAFQLALASEMEKLNVSGLFQSIRFKNPSVDNLRTRIAIDAGSILFGRYGGLGTAISIPVITTIPTVRRERCVSQGGRRSAGH